jgi:hypothetical protein
MSRVIDISGPTIQLDRNGDPQAARNESADLQAEVAHLASNHYGWPLRWLTESEWPVTEALPQHTKKGDDLYRLSELVAVAAQGFAILARLCDYPEDVDATALGWMMFQEIAERYRDLGTTSADRFWDALSDFVTRNGYKIRPEDGVLADAPYERADLIGRRWNNGDVALLPTVARELAESLDFSLDTILGVLAADGRLVRGKKKLVTRQRIAAGADSQWVYHFVDVYHRPGDTDEAEAAEAVKATK